MKLTVIGGGSTYTPELIDGFARLRDVLPLTELALMDPDPHRLSLVSGVSQRMFDHAGYNVKVTSGDDVEAAVDGADAVLLQLRVGNQAARHTDETFPHSCGVIGQETTGPGGLAKALRTVPVVRDLGEKIRKHANDDAWIVDFTNPTGIVTRALLNDGHKAVGLCNVAIGFRRRFAEMLGVDWTRVELDHVGLNHLTWERGVLLDGKEVLPGLIADRGQELHEMTGHPLDLIKMQESVPSYYLEYYYDHDRVLSEQTAPDAVSRAHAVIETENALLEKYADPAVVTKPAELEKRGGAFYSDAAVDLIASLTADRQDSQVVNIANNGVFPWLPDDHVIEVPAICGADGITVPDDALARRPLAEDQIALISHVAGYERLALDAAIHGGRDRVVRALLAHPMVGQWDKATKLADEMIAINKDHLPWT